MKDIALQTETYDLALEDGDLATVDGVTSTAQEAHIALRTFRGEWRLDLREGIDYFGRVFGKGKGDAVRDAEIKRALSSIDNFVELVDYQVEIDARTRELDVDFQIRTSDDDALIGFGVDPLAFLGDIPGDVVADGYYVDGELVPVPDGYWVDGENTGEPDLAIYPRSAWFETLPLMIETYEGEAE